MRNKNLLLLLLVSLLVIRFAILPLQQWQTDTYEQIQLYQKRQDRGEQLLQQQEQINQIALAWQQLSAQLTTIYPAHQNPGDAQLSAQQRIQALVSANNARFELFDWLVLPEQASANLQQATVKLRVSGTPAAISALHAELVAQPHLQLISGAFNWQRQLSIHSSVTTSFDLVYRYQLTDTE
ncbi:hypothetical protein [Rheinheimera gaetbuli]